MTLDSLRGLLFGMEYYAPTKKESKTVTYSPSTQYEYAEAWQYTFAPVVQIESPEAVARVSATKKDTVKQEPHTLMVPRTTGGLHETKESTMGALMPYLVMGGLVVGGLLVVKGVFD